jgi:hypothetical protein
VRPDGGYDIAAAKLVLTLLDAVGEERFLLEWAGGGLDPLLGTERHEARRMLLAERAEARARVAELERALAAAGTTS